MRKRQENPDLAQLRKRLKSLQEDLQRARNSFQANRDRLHREEADVRNLESISFSSFLAAITGDKSERLKREKEEVLTARLQYDAAKRALVDLKKEEDALRKRIAALRVKNAPAKPAPKHAAPIKLSPTPPPLTDTDLEAFQNQLREIDEAIRDGRRALRSLRRFREAVHTPPPVAITHYQQYQQMHEVQRLTRAVQRSMSQTSLHLGRFQRRLRDLGLQFRKKLPRKRRTEPESLLARLLARSTIYSADFKHLYRPTAHLTAEVNRNLKELEKRRAGILEKIRRNDSMPESV